MKKPNRVPRVLILTMIGFALFTVTLPAVFWYRLQYSEVCPLCALKRETQEWQIPFSSITYYGYLRLENTALSEALAELKLVDPHEHQWLVIGGTGPGYHLIYGVGRQFSETLTSPSVGRFVRLLDRYSDKETMSYWFALMTHPKHSPVVADVADRCASRNYEDAGEFEAYLEMVKKDRFQRHFYRTGLTINEPETQTPPRLLYQRSPR